MLWKPLLQVSCLFLCTAGQTQGRLYTARRKPASGSHQRNRFGPHMCHSAVGAGSGCCPGWAPSPSTGQCVLPICPFGCGSGFCIAPNVCSCRSGQQSITCPDEGVATDFLAQYVEGAHGKGSSHSCVSAMCEHSCLIISGVPVCSCFHGYSLGKDGRSCYDVDECSRSRGPALCQHQCRNSLGSYRCHCYHGYQISSNGRSCIPVKSMTPNEVPGVCGEYGCTLSCNHGGCEHISRVCPPGFSMSELANGVMCIDIDECETASCEGICLNTDGGFVCECKPGMQLSADRQSCVDIDECSGNRAPCQQRCRNIYGSYKCLCNPGYTLHGNGHSCTDLNECRRPGGARLCQHACQNTFGSYFCVCRSGFKLHADKVSCEDVDECSLSADRLLLPCLHLCLNTAGSYLCSCHQGYQLAADGHTCQESPDFAGAPAPILHSSTEAVPTTVVPSYPRGFMKPPPTLSSSPPSHYFHPSPGPGPPAREAAAPTFPPLHSSPPSVQPAPMPTKPTPTNGSVVGPLTSMPSLPAPFTKSPVKSLTRTPSPLAPTTKSPVSQQNITSLPLITSPSTLTTKTPGERLPSTTSPPMPLTTSAFVSLSTTQSPTVSTTDRLFISLTPTSSSLPSPSPTSSPPRTPFTAPSSLRVPTTRSHLTPLTTPADSPLAQKASKIAHISLKEDLSPPALLQPLPESPASSLISMAESHTITPPPTMCWHEGTWHIDGSHWEGPGCLQCVCQAGHVLCQEVVCNVPCSHPVPVPGQCCPSCDGCLYEGVFRAEGDVFPLTEDDCVVCICIAGNVTCISPDCPVVTCLDPILSDCCLRCPAECVFRDQTYPHGAEFSRDGDKCSSCVCRNGEVECSFAPCPMLDCPREDWLLEPGECCFTCQEFQTMSGCPVDDNGVEFPIGQIWSPGDPCEICVCQADSTVNCKKTECIETCPHPILVPGQCCPDCSAGCSYGRTIFQNNESFPSPSDPCLTCICLFGSVACSPLECTISCTYPFHAEGDCCPVCRDCTYEGRKVLDGQAFLTEKDPCTQCTCQRGEVSCEEITCQLSCTDPYTPPGECCPTCSECLYEGQVLEDGGYYVSKYDPCILCNCEAGNVDCEWRGDDCPQLDCEQEPIHPAGTCCPLCPDEDLTSLSEPMHLQFDEMEPIKIFRNPRGASHRQLHSIDLLQSSTPPVQQINPHRIILPKATDNLKIVHSLSAKEQTTLHRPEAPNSKLEFHIDSKHGSLFPVTAETGTRTIVMSFSNPTALPISLPTTSILPPGLSDSSLPPIIAPVFSDADPIPPLTMEIVPMPPQTSTSAISLMSLPHFRIHSFNHISSRVAFSSQLSSTATILSLPPTTIPASCLNHLNASTENTSGPRVSSSEPATSLPLESHSGHSGLFKYPKQLLAHSPSITASSSLTPSPVGVLQPSLSPMVKGLNAVPNYVLPMTRPTEYVQSFSNVHSHSLPQIGVSDTTLSDAEIARPSVFPTPVYATIIPSTDIAHPLFFLKEDPVASNSWESDSSLPLTGTFEVPLQPSKITRGMNEPYKIREHLMTAAEWNHKQLMQQTDTNMQGQRSQSDSSGPTSIFLLTSRNNNAQILSPGFSEEQLLDP